MPVPFEALIPYAIIVGMFGVTGTGLSIVRKLQNEGKRPRYNLDTWDRVCCSAALDASFVTDTGWQAPANIHSVIMRDVRLTGTRRGQSDAPEAPPGFELNNGWSISKRIS